MKMTNALLLYHSGVGNTKFISYIIGDIFRRNNADISINSVEKVDINLINQYSLIIIGFPTYHAEPSDTIIKFINSLPFYKSPKFAFIYTTCGLYSANALYDFAKILAKKNIFVIHSASYRCPATDFSLIAPWFKPTLNFENHLKNNVLRDIRKSITNFRTKKVNPPKFKIYSILNFPNKIIGKKVKRKIQINYSLCINCNKCINNCPHNCLGIRNNRIVFKINNCENCYRCIHHCPKRALSLNKNKPTIQFNETFYKYFN
jgi:ferredoxin/flavodoxin